MVRLIGIIGGIIAGWYASQVGNLIVLLALALASVLTAANLFFALKEWKTRPVAVIDEAIKKAIVSPDPSELPGVLKDIKEAHRLGGPSLKIIWRYIWVCFLLNVATIGVAAILTYFIISFVR
jgi:hypothetical protein